MKNRDQNRKKAAAEAEAAHPSKKAVSVLRKAFATRSEHDRRAVALALQVCALFGGQIVKVQS